MTPQARRPGAILSVARSSRVFTSWLLDSTDGLDVGAVAGHQFVLFEELGALMAPRRPCSPPLPATMLPHHNGEVAMPRRWKTLIFLPALLAT